MGTALQHRRLRLRGAGLVADVHRLPGAHLRWQIILAPTKRVSFVSAFAVLMVGFTANNLLPARIGELVRAYTLGRKENLSKSLSLATIVVERVFDGITIMGFLVVALTRLSLCPVGARCWPAAAPSSSARRWSASCCCSSRSSALCAC